MLSRFVRAVYGIYALTAFVVVVLLAFCPVLIVAPRLSLRRAIGRLTVRTWLASIGVPLHVKGLHHLPRGPCVVVCNHASYVDGIVLTSALPVRFTFLVQHRIRDWPYIGLIVRRMGVCFVERDHPRRAARATLGLVRSARQGGSLAIFPEGTFQKEAGLQPFFAGAFFISAKSALPVVPAVIHGSRRLFHDGARWPTWSPLCIEILPPLGPAATDGADVHALKQRAFRVIEKRTTANDRGIRAEPNSARASSGAAHSES